MLSYIFRRILYAIPLLVVISFISFIIINLPPGDYLTTFKSTLMSRTGISKLEAERIAAEVEKKYGLDKPFIAQYFNWIKNIVLKGDFGYSFNYKRPVSEVIWSRLGMTMLIALGAHMISVVVGVIIGIFSAIYKYGVIDTIFTVLSFLALSVPPFFVALVLMYLISVKVGGHVGGFFSPEYVMADWNWAKFIDFLKHIWIPIFVVGLAGTARNMRVMRTNLLDVLNQQYIMVARAKGLKKNHVIFKHALRNAIQPIVMYLGMSLPFLIQGAMVSSIVLSLPTTGPMFFTALNTQDMYLAGSFLMMLSVTLVIGNLLSDILLALVDPRVSYE